MNDISDNPINPVQHQREIVPAPQSGSGAVRRTCLLVLGMHRSGTSALTRVLSLAGAKLPRRLLGANEGNAAGHWESEPLIAYNDQLLAQLGSAWHDWAPLDFGRLPPGGRQAIKIEIADVIAQDYGNAALFVIKEPRICRFVALFVDALRDRSIDVVPIIPVRNPLEVIGSLQARDGMARSDAALLWLRHVLDAEAATRDTARVLTSYEGLLADWRKAINAIATATATATGVRFPYAAEEIAPDVESFLQPDLRHHRWRLDDVVLDPMLRGWVSEAFEALSVLVRSPGNQQALAQLDEVRQTFDRATPALRAVLAATEQASAAKVGALTKQRNDFAAERDSLAVRVPELEGELHRVREALDGATAERDTLASRSAMFEAELARVRDTLAASTSDRAALAGRVTELESELSSVREGLAAAMAKRDALAGRVAELQGEQDQLRHTLGATVNSLEQELAARERDLVEERQAHAALQGTLSGLQSALSARYPETASGALRSFGDAPVDMAAIVAGLLGELDDTSARFSQTRAYVSDLEQQVAELTRLRDDGLALHCEAVAQKSAEAEQLAAQLAAMSRELASERETLARVSAEAESRRAVLLKDVDSRDAEIGDLAAQLRDSQSQVAELESVLSAHNLENRHLLEKHSGLKDDLYRLHKAIGEGINRGLSVRGQAVALVPVNDLRFMGRKGTAIEWDMTGNDPSFQLELDTGLALAPGHYRLLVDFPEGWSHLVLPCLYIGGPNGYDAASTLPLTFRGRGQMQAFADFSLINGAPLIRFDPSNAPGRLVIGKVRITKHSRLMYYALLGKRVWKSRIHSSADLRRAAGISFQTVRHSGMRGLAGRLRQQSAIANMHSFPAPQALSSELKRTPKLEDVLRQESYGLRPDVAVGRAVSSSNIAVVGDQSTLKVLFVSYGAFNCNSGGHIAHFANELAQAGHVVGVCAEGDKKSASDFGKQHFHALSRSEVDANPDLMFNIDNGRIGPENTIIHAWTPREKVRMLAEKLVAAYGCRYVVHLEDNEDVLTASSLGLKVSDLFKMPVGHFDNMPDSLSHPVRYRNFISRAAGVTVIVDRLTEYIPSEVPTHVLEPGVDADLFKDELSSSRRSQMRNRLNVRDNEILCLYSGNMHAANQREIFSLYTAIEILNRRGNAVRLMRTGNNFGDGLDVSFRSLSDHVIDLGFVSRNYLIELLKLADFFIQPGKADMFNNYRLPSKLPEFLAAGKPLILPASNIGLRLRDREDALLLRRGDGVEIADRAEEFLKDPALRARLGVNARRFGRERLDWRKNAEGLLAFYSRGLATHTRQK